MKKFVALYMAPVAEMDKMMKDSTPEDQKKGMDAWIKWMGMHKDDFVEQGAPLGKNKRVTKDSVSDKRNEVTGYSVVQADSHEEAAQIFKDSPHLQMPGAYVEVLEWVEMPGM